MFNNTRKENQDKQNQKEQKKRITQSSRAGLVFPVGRIGRYIRTKSTWNKNVSASAPVYLAAAMEYLCAELLEVSGLYCKHAKKRIIKPEHIEYAIRSDSDFERFFQHKTIAKSGKVPFILPCLLKQISKK